MNQLFSRSKITNDNFVGKRIYKNIVWFHVSMCDVLKVHVHKAS